MSELDDIDLLAAEYVLGTLDPAERADVTRRLPAEPALARAVEQWTQRLAPLSELSPSTPAPRELFEKVEARLFGRVTPLRAARSEVRRWQISTAGFAALAAALALWIALGLQKGSGDEPQHVAVLQRDPGAPAMVLDVDLARRAMTLRAVDTTTPAGKSYELWIIDPSLGPPKSLGILAGTGLQRSLPDLERNVILQATYAITVEPPGGAPGGKPSGAPVFAGKLGPGLP